MDVDYAGQRYVDIDLHRRRSVIVQMSPEGERLGAAVRIDNDPFELARQVASWGESPEVVLEATYGWYWASVSVGSGCSMSWSWMRRTPPGWGRCAG